MLFRFLLLFIIIYTLTTCHRTNVNDKIQTNDNINLDAAFEHFEDIAYNHSEQYISNPDSFFNTVKVSPKTTYQKELLAYGIIFIAATLMENGIIYESVKYYEKAYNYAKKENIEIEDINNTLIKPLANLYTRINDTEKAISLLENTIQKTRNKKDIIGLSNNLATAYLYNNQTDKAEKILEESLKNSIDPINKGLLYNTLASINYENKELEKSIENNRNAIRNFEKKTLNGDTILWYISALGLYAEIHQDSTYTRKALQLLHEKYPKTQNRLKSKILSVEAEIIKSFKEIENLDRYNTIIDLLTKDNKKNILDYTYTKALIGKAKHYVSMNNLDSAIYFYEKGIENDFRTQQLITSQKDQIRNNINNKKILEELIDLIDHKESLKRNSNIIQKLLWCIELSKARLLINEINRSDQWNISNINTKSAIHKIQALYQQKDESGNKLQKQKIQEQINRLLTDFQLSEQYFETIRFVPNKDRFFNNLTDRNTDYYSYYITRNHDIIIIQKSGSKFKYHKIATEKVEIDSFKVEYFGNSPNRYNNNPKEYFHKSNHLATLLLPELTNANVFISLDGNLYGLPFDALMKEDFLVLKHNFAYLNSFLLFDILSTSYNNKSDISLLFRSDYSPPLASLGFVQKEIENIKSLFQSEAVSPEEQTDEMLKEQFAKSNIIHIAAHTILDSSEAPIVYLRNPISTNQIRYFEIKSPLVFLSACNTGTGESLPAEGTESLQRVFLSKSVPSVVSTYWFANDETMLNITDKFYQLLHQSNSPLYALAEAKRQYLAQTNQQLKNPWYWANINYSGINNNIGLKKTSNLYLIILICLCTTIIVAVAVKKLSKKS